MGNFVTSKDIQELFNGIYMPILFEYDNDVKNAQYDTLQVLLDEWRDFLAERLDEGDVHFTFNIVKTNC